MNTPKILSFALCSLTLSVPAARADIADHKFSIAASVAFLGHAGYELHHAWKQAYADLNEEKKDQTEETGTQQHTAQEKDPKKPTLKDVARHMRWKRLAFSGLVAGSVVAAEQYPQYTDRAAHKEAQKNLHAFAQRLDACRKTEKNDPKKAGQEAEAIAQECSELFKNQLEQKRFDISLADLEMMAYKRDTVLRILPLSTETASTLQTHTQNYDFLLRCNRLAAADTLNDEQKELIQLALEKLSIQHLTQEKKSRFKALCDAHPMLMYRWNVVRFFVQCHARLASLARIPQEYRCRVWSRIPLCSCKQDLAKIPVEHIPEIKKYFEWLVTQEVHDASLASEMRRKFNKYLPAA